MYIHLTFFSLEDFLDEPELEIIKQKSMQYANLGDFMFVPKKVTNKVSLSCQADQLRVFLALHNPISTSLSQA